MGAETKFGLKINIVFNVFLIIFFTKKRPYSVKKCHLLQASWVKISLPHKKITFNRTFRTYCIKSATLYTSYCMDGRKIQSNRPSDRPSNRTDHQSKIEYSIKFAALHISNCLEFRKRSSIH